MFAFVWYEQGTMLSKGRLRPADARDVVVGAGGSREDAIALIAIHQDVDGSTYADCKGVVTQSGTFNVYEDLIIDPNDPILGRLARLSEGAQLLRNEEMRGVWERVTNASVRFVSDDAEESRLSVNVRAAFERIRATRQQIDAVRFLAAYFALGEGTSNRLRSLMEEQRGTEVLQRMLTSEPAVLHDLEGWLGQLVEVAQTICNRASARAEPIVTRHIVAALLRREPRELSVIPALLENGYDVDALRQAFAQYLAEQHPDEPLAVWRAILTDPSTFDIANRVTTDIWTLNDSLGYAKYAQAIADSILYRNAPPPLTIGIQAPWGQGKTSLMRMIQARLDPASVEREVPRTANPDVTAAVRTTYGELLAWMRDPQRIRRAISGFGTRLSAWLERRLLKHTNDGSGMLRPKQGTIPSVWFNPLYYRETSQVWAGLAHAILHQLVEQLPSAKQHEEFWLRLQVSRINVSAVRRDIHLWLLTRAVPRGLFWIAVAIAFMFVPNLSDLGRALGSGGSLVAAALHLWATIEKRTIDHPFEKYISEPAYQSELGMLHLVDHDLDRALRLLVADRPIAVFIDDLDRCDPQTVKQVVLAINQFLSLRTRNVYFFLGMDMEMVAASLEEAQKSSPQLFGRRQSFGWRFMEKFIQLPFVIPHLDPKTARQFAAGHLRGNTPGAARSETKIDLDGKLAEIDHAAAPSEIGRIAREVAENTELDPASRARLEERFSKRTTELMQDPESDEVQRIVDIAIRDLDLNPRTIKRYFCLVRVLRNIQIASGSVSNADNDRKIVLRAAHLLLNWPQFVQWLRNTPDLPGSGAKTIDEIEAAAKSADAPAWNAKLQNLIGADLPPYLTDPTLYRFLNRISGEAPGLRALYDGGMF